VKTKRSILPDGRLELKIAAPADAVQEAVDYLLPRALAENGIEAEPGKDLYETLLEQVGEAFLTSYLDYRVPFFLAGKVVGQEKIKVFNDPEIKSPLPHVLRKQHLILLDGQEPAGQQFQPLEFSALLVLKPDFELSSYEPVSIILPNLTVSDEEVDEQLQIYVSEFQTDESKPLPEIDDDWVKANDTAADTVAQLRERIRRQGILYKEQEREKFANFSAASELSMRLEGDIDELYFEITRKDLLQSLTQSLQAQGRTLVNFIVSQGGEESFQTTLMFQAYEIVRQGFALDALARHLKLSLDKKDIARALVEIAPGFETALHEDFEQSGRMYVLEEMAMRIKASRWLVDSAHISYQDFPDPEVEELFEADGEAPAKAEGSFPGNSNNTEATGE
jgi:hypothetical protein